MLILRCSSDAAARPSAATVWAALAKSGSRLVASRAHEFGIRAALGADANSIILLVLRTGARPTLLGLLFGVAAAVAASTLLKSLLFGIAPHDPVTFAAVPLFFAAVALAAGIVPARRAARLNPMEALRAE